MSASHPAAEAWTKWWEQLDLLAGHVRRVKGVTVSSSKLRSEAKAAVQFYFRDVRIRFEQLQLDPIHVQYLDPVVQRVLELSSRANRKSTYLRTINELSDLRSTVETALEIKAASGGQSVTLTTATEAAIIETLQRILPTSALSYKQVLQDLSDVRQSSFRGTAAELREVLRELLDHLAPDKEVLKSVKLEKDQRRLTMKQKTIFILKARGVGETRRRPAENAAAAVEESVGSFARSVYDQGSLSTHVAATRREVLTFKGYADAVLADLLEIHK